jgi:allophanate hydrolase
VVPACQSLDCVSVFALTAPDAIAVFDVARGPDAADPYSRNLQLWPVACGSDFRFAIPEPLEFYGDAQAHRAFDAAVAILQSIGGHASKAEFSPFLEAASLLYEGPWVAERMAAIRPFFQAKATHIHPVVREIIGGATKYSATDLFQGMTRLHALSKRTAHVWESVDVMVVPTAPTAYTTAQVLGEPFQTNRRLGHYTNFVNLLDLAAFAVPASLRADGLPYGITLIGPAGSDRLLADLAQRFHQRTGLNVGALNDPLPPPTAIGAGDDSVTVTVVGAHLHGLPLNYELTRRGARLERTTRTASRYRLFALPGTTPPKPGMVRDADGGGSAIELEVWRMPSSAFGSFVAGIPSPLGIGSIELEDGQWVQGFLCESWALAGAEDISHFGGWRAYLASRTKR